MLTVDRPTWVDIDLDALRDNYGEIRRHIPATTGIMTVIKADGYGYGAFPMARLYGELGARYLAVAILSEAMQLRRKGIDTPILILGYTEPGSFETLIKRNITQTVYSADMAKALSDEAVRLGKTARIHIKIDTGMGRLGFAPGQETVEEIKSIAALPGICLEGLFTHLSVADENDRPYTDGQIDAFLQIARDLEEAGIHIPLKHIANSAATVLFPRAHQDMVRPGLILYGYAMGPVAEGGFRLKPSLTLKSRIAHVKTMEAGQSISYGRTYEAKGGERVATVPIGYADGYPRSLSNIGEVLVGGKRARILGRVCMDQLMVDVSAVPDAKVGDEVVLYGRQGREEVTLQEVSDKTGLTIYELLCMLSKRVPRCYFEGGRMTGMTVTAEENRLVNLYPFSDGTE